MEEQQFSVTLDRVAEESGLTVAYTPKDLKEIKVYAAEVYRPGIMLAGYYQYFDSARIQIIGLTEMSYLNELEPDIRRTHLEKLFSFQPPAVVISRDMEPLPEMLEFAKQYGVALLLSSEMTSPLMSSMITTLNTELAPRITRHGVLVEVYGEGILHAWASPAWARARPPLSWSSAATGSSPTTRWNCAASLHHQT